MLSLQIFLDYALYFTEGLTALIAIFYLSKLKQTNWKYFVLYLLLIFSLESFGRYGNEFLSFSKEKFYNYFVIPLEFLFWYWLYAIQSMKNRKLFYWLISLYIISFIPSEFFFKGSKIIYSFNYTFGCFLLLFLVIFEYYKQINADTILDYKKNRMFYINIGVTLFYIGTLPFYTFYLFLYRDHNEIWSIYYVYSYISNILMYLLFAASFIWGKQSS